ncbi:hypothetical protein AACH06_01530 [Ideonella sp. DXS29W]|uniref:L,D-transpeptidase n=1 Tax=Ideonella lacteola TaxID=2984193 RepID=A0ABU9BLU9_9BURK
MMISKDITQGLKQGLLMGTVILAALLALQPHLWPGGTAPTSSGPKPGVVEAPVQAGHAPGAVLGRSAVPTVQRRLDWNGVSPSGDVRRLAQWVVDSADNGTQHFVILDKRRARVYVFEPGGRLAGDSPVLLGFAAGDDTVPGIGDKPISEVKPQERTTPAGRFEAARGRNANQEDVVWVDYEAAVSMHRVRATNPKERRLERLATPTSADNRISYGCINLPVAFFEQVVWPPFQSRPGIVYVLPEVRPLTDVFPGVQTPYHVVSAPSLSHPSDHL